MADMPTEHGAGSDDRVVNPDIHHEESDVNIRGIFAFAGALIVVAVIVHVAMWLLLRFFDVRADRQDRIDYPLAIEQERRLPPEPRLQTNPREDLQNLRTSENDILTSYGWVDRNAGIVRIPIDEAIKLTLQRGLPARAEPQQR
jgi:hypothetical protein